MKTSKDNLKKDILVFGFPGSYCIILNAVENPLIVKGNNIEELVFEFILRLEEKDFPEYLEAEWFDFLADDHNGLHEDDDRDQLLDNFLMTIRDWILNRFIEVIENE